MEGPVGVQEQLVLIARWEVGQHVGLRRDPLESHLAQESSERQVQGVDEAAEVRGARVPVDHIAERTRVVYYMHACIFTLFHFSRRRTSVGDHGAIVG